MLRIIVGESFGQFWLFGLTPFELVGMQNTVDVFQIIDFLLLLGSPKVTFTIEKAIGIVLQALTHKKVFPQRPRVLSKLKRLEIAKNRIAHPIVEEIDFPAFLQLVSQIAAERTQMK